MEWETITMKLGVILWVIIINLGRRPNSMVILISILKVVDLTNFTSPDLYKTKRSNFLIGFGHQGDANRDNWSDMVAELGHCTA